MRKYKVLRFFDIIFAIFFFIGAIVYIALSNSVEVNSAEQNTMTVAGIICIVLFILCVVFSVKLKKKIEQPIIEAQQKAAEAYQQKLLEHQNYMREIGAVMEVYGKHA